MFSLVIFLAAIGQPLIVNSSSRIANDWFPIHERDFAVHVMTQANYVGSGLGCIIPALQITNASDIPNILYQHAFISFLVLICSIIFVKNEPLTPPGLDVEKQIAHRKLSETPNIHFILTQMGNDFKEMLMNFNFNLVQLSFAFQISVTWAFQAVIGQMISPCGYDNYIVGLIGASVSFTGIFGSFLLTLVMRKYKNYLVIQKFLMIGTAVTLVVSVLNVSKHNATWLLITWTLYGLFQGPLTPICLEHAAEITYPIPANNSTSLIFSCVNCMCLGLTFVLTQLLLDTRSATCTTASNPATWLILSVSVIGALLCLPITEQYNRIIAAGNHRETRKVYVVIDSVDDKRLYTSLL